MLQLKRRRLAFLLVDAWHIDDAIELTTMEMSYASAQAGVFRRQQ